LSKKQKKERTVLHKTINWIVAFAIAFIIIFILLFGFSQTQTFREYLRETIIAQADSSINGNLSIGSIEGSIFTSLKINDITLTSQLDTILSANKLELHISPLQILLRKIYIRKLLGNDISVHIKELKPGISNISTLSKSSGIKDSNSVVENTSEQDSPFPFIVQVNNIELLNLSFINKSFENLSSHRMNEFMNFNDLELRGINLKSKMLANIAEEDFQIIINQFTCSTNVSDFNIRSLSGAFHLSENFVEINKFNLVTDSSNISIDTKLVDLNLLTNVELSDFKNYPITLDLKAEPFTFYDLSRFLPELDFLKGSPNLDLEVDGVFGEINLRKLQLEYEQSYFDVSGKVSNLHTPDLLYLDVSFNNSRSNFNDVNTLLPELDLPDYKSLEVHDFSLTYKGKPAKFNTSFNGKVADGELKFNSKLDFSGPDFIYDIDFVTRDLDISELLETQSSLTTNGKLKGIGTDPTKLEAEFKLDAYNTIVNGYSIDSLTLDLTAKSKVMQLDISSIINEANTSIEGRLDLTNENSPIYDLSGNFENLNLAKFMESDEYESSLNFQFVTNGEGLNLDEMVGEFNLSFDESMMKSSFFEDASIDLELIKDNEYREINLVSNFVDFSITGDFLLQDAIDLLDYQTNLTSKIITQKINDLNPIADIESNQQFLVPEVDSTIFNKSLEFDFEFDFKDFELIALLIDQEELGIAGFGSGDVSNSSNSFSINSDLELDYFYTLTGEDLLYLSNLETNINFTKDNTSNSFDNLFGALSIGSDRIVAGSNVKNFTADFIFNQSKLIYNFSTEVDTFLTTEIDGSMQLVPGNQLLAIDNILVNYKDIPWKNKDRLFVELANDSLLINDLRIYSDSSFLKLDGILTGYSENDLVLVVDKLPGNLITYYAFDLYDENFIAQSKFTSNITGTLKKPKFDLDFRVDNITVDNNNLGNFQLYSNYSDNNLDVNMAFLDSLSNYEKPFFSAAGKIPFYFDSDKDYNEVSVGKLFTFSFEADSFNIASIGSIIPTVSNQQGFLNCDLSINGYNEGIELNGNLDLENITFRSTLNNLDYKSSAEIVFVDDEININNFTISNLRGSRIQGNLLANGNIKLTGFNIKNIDINFDGGLGVLGFRSQTVSPAVYGNLFLETRNTVKYTYANNINKLDGNILLKGMDLIYAPINTGYANSRDVVYEFKVDSSKIDKEEIKFNRLVNLRSRSRQTDNSNSTTNFDYLLNFKIDEEAKIDFILSSSFNQKLSVLADGDMRFASVGGQSSAQGQFTLLDGSKLEFFKVLDAEGFIRFDANIADPYLDIIATYNTIYNEPGGTTTPVAVKMNINGNYSSLGQNLAANSENIRVYSGQRNIDDGIPDLRYDAKNALSFILIGKPNFTLGAESGGTFADDIAVEAATSFLGSTLTSLLNSRIGDAINDIKFQRDAVDQNHYQFDVSGRIQNVRYSIGGNTKNFNNLSQANLKIEYLFNQNFLIRAERKSALRDITNEAAKISELGLRYIFVF
jgi:hypothetical protein